MLAAGAAAGVFCRFRPRLMQETPIFHALQLAVSPVILLSAYGLLMLSMTNRLGRAIDRARQLVAHPEPHHHVQLGIISKRAAWIRSSILFNAIAMFAASLLVIVLFLSALLPVDIRVAVSILFLVSLASLVVSLVFFITDIFASLRAMEAELSAREVKSGS
jgi:hypothetical protein